MATDPVRRRIRRATLEEGLAYERRSGRLKVTVPNQRRVIDLARVDTADWLDPGYRRGAPARPRAIDQVTTVAAEAMTRTWPVIVEAIGADEPVLIRRQLARHAWCDLLVGLAGALGRGTRVKDTARAALLRSSWSDERERIGPGLADVVATSVWAAVYTTALGRFAPLGPLTTDETVRTLRILALFRCPDPAKHREVRSGALRPLCGIVADGTRGRLAGLFADL